MVVWDPGLVDGIGIRKLEAGMRMGMRMEVVWISGEVYTGSLR